MSLTEHQRVMERPDTDRTSTSSSAASHLRESYGTEDQRTDVKGHPVDRDLPTRFWIEAVVAGAGLALFLLTLFTREWIEMLTGLDPDGGSGALEFSLALGLLVVAAASAFLARRTYTSIAAA